jgi:hypothetical protein
MDYGGKVTEVEFVKLNVVLYLSLIQPDKKIHGAEEGKRKAEPSFPTRKATTSILKSKVLGQPEFFL